MGRNPHRENQTGVHGPAVGSPPRESATREQKTRRHGDRGGIIRQACSLISNLQSPTPMLLLRRLHRAATRSLVSRMAITFCLAATLVFWATPSRAQGDGETEVARQRFREGVAHYDHQDYEKARLAFLQAYLLKPHSAVLLNLAQSELRAGRYGEAAEHFAKYIRENPSAAAMDHAKAGFEEARQKVTELNVQVNATGAAVSIDGADVGRSPLPNALYLMPGRHSVVARKADASAEKVLDAVAGRREYIALEMREGYDPSPLVPSDGQASASGQLAASGPAGSTPGADGGTGKSFFGWIGSSPAAFATVTVAGLALGTSAVLAGFASNRYSAANDARSQIMAALQQYVDAGVVGQDSVPCGATGIASGMATFDSSYSQNQRTTVIGEFKNACSLFNERSDSGDRLKTLALVSLGVGAFATIGTIVWYFSDSDGGGGSADGGTTPRGSASLSPILSPDTQGLMLNVAF
jgi:hypothetical protein